MGCENVTFNEPTNKRSQSLEIHAKTTLRINQERNVCLFTPYANYEEVVFLVAAVLTLLQQLACWYFRWWETDPHGEGFEGIFDEERVINR